MPDTGLQGPDPQEDDRFLALQADFEDTFVGLTCRFQFDDELDRDAAIDQVVADASRNSFRTL